MADQFGMGYGGQGMMGMMYPQLMGPMRQQMYGQALLNQAADVSPVRSPYQALARALSGALGGYEMNQGQQAAVAANQGMQDQAAQFFGLGGGTSFPLAPQVTSAPQQQQAASPSSGVPAVSDPNITGNNYGNIRPVGATTGFNAYNTPQDGIAAMARQLAINQKDHGLNTLRQTITRWAPASDGNNPDQYAATVAKAAGFDPDANLNFSDPAVLAKVIPAMAQVEHGKPMGVGDDVLTAGIGQGLGTDPIVAINASEQGGASNTAAGGNPASGFTTSTPGAGWMMAQHLIQQSMLARMSPNPYIRAAADGLIEQAKMYMSVGNHGPLIQTADGRLLQSDLSGKVTQVGEPLRPESQILSDLASLGAKYRANPQSLTGEENIRLADALNARYPWTTEVIPGTNTTRLVQKTPQPGNLPRYWELTGSPPPAGVIGPGAVAPAAGTSETPLPTETQVMAGREAFNNLVNETNKDVTEELTAAGRGQDIYATTNNIRSLMQQTRMGWSADARAEGARILQGLGVDPKTAENWFGTTPLQNTQALSKLFMQQTMQAVRSTLGAREPGSLVLTAMNRFPNLETQPEAADIMLRLQEMEQGFHKDRANALADYVNQGVAKATTPGGKLSDFRGMAGFGWDNDPRNSAAVYGAAGMLMATRGRDDLWARGLTKPQRIAAQTLASRMYPGEYSYTPPAGS